MRSTLSHFAQQLIKATCLIGLFAACALLVDSRPPTKLEQIQADGVLRVASINGPETYYEDPDGNLTGFEYSLAAAFADYLGVSLEIVPTHNFGEILDLVKTGKTVDMAAAGMIVTKRRQQSVSFSDPYLEISQLLIYRNGTGRPTELESLFGRKIMVMEDSSEAERLSQISAQYPQLEWSASADYNSMDLIEQVHVGEIDFALVKSTAYAISQSVYPRARIAYTFPEKQPLAWAFQQSNDESLKAAANRFLTSYKADNRLANLEATHFHQEPAFNAGGALAFTNRIRTRLPKWETLLKETAANYEFDWLMLAAISYQESHWNPRARSYTGVRGLMMLTRTTAHELGIENRLDPVQSVEGGTRYLSKIMTRLPKGIQGQDRLWMALAAYNVGFGHLMDARRLARKHGKNPNSWDDIAEILPLLAQRKHYKNTRHGYARGWEPVNYVNNIRQFHTILAWHKQVEQRRLAMAETTILSANEHTTESDLRSSL
ncbi:membrane-bound lytic murein transglycosylase MltF [Simiduia aestuariiviva]|uniref:Membrane-bound lytic murein transglycosylase F n=1 Tax=Simiduia aestuariiviva TaxID=1510459 RepID=A0A839UK45_9GAMM|nr:membrane-bound lytic murein transglycosylase MltF [Simiduia aestuariiviva]MBB3168222.1 membrane-bound lytic murein transglycosylase F [Simiduia aestuariiviva]